MVRVIGLTGGIGMGKSTVAAAFRRAHVPVFDADAEVHRLQGPGGRAVSAIGAAFPGVLSSDIPPRVNRDRLRARVLPDPAALKRLEQIVHPLVRASERRFLQRACRAGRALAVLDIPLLLETRDVRTRCGTVDYVMVVSAPAAVQRARVRRRRRMTEAQIVAIIAKQLPDAEKRRRADVVIRTGLSRGFALAQLRRFLRSVIQPKGLAA